MLKKQEKSVVCPERDIIIEDLNPGSLGISRPDFCPVGIPRGGGACKGYGISDLKRFENIPVFHYTIRPCNSDINLTDKVESFSAPHGSYYLWIRGKTVALDLDFDFPCSRQGLGWSRGRRYDC